MSSSPTLKTIKDPIYGFVEVPIKCQLFIDTPEFQRLRRIKQLGNVHQVFPSATHTRFEHSIGVMHLAGKVVDHLRQFVNIDANQKELIQLAGLLHDIGHFAYSHLFDHFLEDLDPKNEDEEIPPDHESRSIIIIKRINYRDNILTLNELNFVLCCIMGYKYKQTHKFLTQIVCNKECGIDVDKMDYLARDAYHTNLPSFQPDYIIRNMIVVDGGSLGFKKKSRLDVEDLFLTRKRMYQMVYFHHAVSRIDSIYKELMKRLGDKLFQFGFGCDDYLIEVLLRTDEETKKYMRMIDCREFSTIEKELGIVNNGIEYYDSGTIDQVNFA